MSSEKKLVGGSSFSFTSQLFGTNDTSSNDIFALFSSNSFEGSQQSEVGGTKSQAYPKSEGNSKYKEGKNHSTTSREMSSIYEQHQTKTHPCHFSSSIYYGGQDVYNTQAPETGLNSSPKKDGGEDDSRGASRGNWWQVYAHKGLYTTENLTHHDILNQGIYNTYYYHRLYGDQ